MTYNPTPSDWLKEHGKHACADGVTFAMKHKTMADVWKHCQRVDWMLWICGNAKIELDAKACRLFACYCVRRTPIGRGKVVWDLLTDERSRNAVIVAEKFAKGKATTEELQKARIAAYAAYAAADAAYAAYAADAAYAAAYATAAATAATAAAADDAARLKASAFQADRLRKVIPSPFLAKGKPCA